MEGLIPLLLNAMKKQRPQNVYRTLSENSSTGRSYHLLVATGDSLEGSTAGPSPSSKPHQPLDFSSGSDHLTSHARSYVARGGVVASPSDGERNGLRQRGFSTSAQHYQVSARTNR